MPLNKEIRVIKVPLSERERLPDYPIAFPRMQRLYLELLENKAKIKQDLINKEHVPVADNLPNFPQQEAERPFRERDRDNYQERHEHAPDELEINEKYSDNDSLPSIDSRSSISIKSGDSVYSGKSIQSNESYGSESRESPRSILEKYSEDERDKGKRSESGDSDDLSVRLKELLGESDDEMSSRSAGSVDDKYSRSHKSFESRSVNYTPYDKFKQDRMKQPRDFPEHGKGAPPPTLAELEAQGQFKGKAELRDINHVTMSEQEAEDKKRELIFKFDLLKKSYPTAAVTIPEYTIHSDLHTMQKSYDMTVRRLSLDSTVESYKTYLIGGFMLVEFVFGNFLGFDMQGFTQQQIISMHTYEKLLIELGEKSYVPSGSKWPVELRLLFLIIMNAGFFIVSKMIMRKTGANLMNMMNSMNTANRAPQANNAGPAPRNKRRMRGPNVNLDDIPDADDQPSQSNSEPPPQQHQHNHPHQHAHAHHHG